MNWSAELVALVPLEVVTVTSTVEADPAGEVAVSWVAELTVKLVAAVVPNSTVLVPVKSEPVMVTVVPPASGPATGLRAVILGVDS